MKKSFGLIFLLALCLAFCACEKDTEAPPLAEGTLYVYNIFADNEPESVTFTLEGELPEEAQEKGSFSGSLTVKESDGTRHTYKDLQFCYFGGKLILHDGAENFMEDSDILCWVDPEAPEELIVVDRIWTKPNPTQELSAYVSSDLSLVEVKSLGAQINHIEGVQEAVFVSAEAALEEFIADHGNDPAFAGVEPSDLRHRYCITILTETTEEAVEQIKAIPGIEDVSTEVMMAERIRILSPEKDAQKAQALLLSLYFPED